MLQKRSCKGDIKTKQNNKQVPGTALRGAQSGPAFGRLSQVSYDTSSNKTLSSQTPGHRIVYLYSKLMRRFILAQDSRSSSPPSGSSFGTLARAAHPAKSMRERKHPPEPSSGDGTPQLPSGAPQSHKHLWQVPTLPQSITLGTSFYTLSVEDTHPNRSP